MGKEKTAFDFETRGATSRRVDLRAQLWRLSLPIFFDLALVMLAGVVDTMMLSRCGDGPVAAIGMVNQLMTLVFLVYQFLSTGAAILCAQYFGAHDEQRFRHTVSLALVLNIAISLAGSVALGVWARPVLSLMGLRDSLMPHGEAYLLITGAMSLFPAVSFVLSADLRSAGRVVEPMAANVTANILNVIGNWVLIFGHLGFPAMGVAGAAWATGFARLAQTALLVAFVSRGARIARPLPISNPFPWKEFKNLVSVGIPAMSEEISYCLSQVATIYFINSISSEALAAKTYCSNLVMFVFLFCLAATQGGDILVGHLVGRGRYAPAYTVGTFFLRRSMLVTLVGSAALAAAGPWIMPLVTANPEIIETGTIVLVLDVVLEIGRVRNIFACGTLRAAGDVIYPVVVGIAVQWSVGVGIAWLLGLPLGLGLVGVWIGFLLDENIRGIILVRRWHSLEWQGKSFAV